MSVANKEQQAHGSPNSDLMVPAPRTHSAKQRHRHVIANVLVGAAIALGAGVAGAAPANADPNAIGTNPNPSSTLSCSCRETAPADSPALSEQIKRGLREGLSAWCRDSRTGPAQPTPAVIYVFGKGRPSGFKTARSAA